MKRICSNLLPLLILLALGCKKDDPAEDTTPAVHMSFEFNFDETLPRLNNLAQPVDVGAGNAAQNPTIDEMSVHYIEFAQNKWTQLGDGVILYKAMETSAGGSNAVEFDQALVAGAGEKFLTLDLSQLPPGTYEWVRASLTYQNGNVDMYYDIDTNGISLEGTTKLSISSFVGFNTYITTHQVQDSLQVVNSNKLQGFWMGEFSIETGYPAPWDTFTWIGQGEADGTTVVNPNPDSPVPPGSCVVTGKFEPALVITGNETENLEFVFTFSINQSFEWKEVNVDGKYEPMAGEHVVDMGLRGFYPQVK